jgi:hypothetical protein
LTRKTYAVYSSGPLETHRVMPTNDDEDLLQLWAKKRGAPNEAEMYMLAKYIGVDVYDIYDWCQYNRVCMIGTPLILLQSKPKISRQRRVTC